MSAGQDGGPTRHRHNSGGLTKDRRAHGLRYLDDEIVGLDIAVDNAELVAVIGGNNDLLQKHSCVMLVVAALVQKERYKSYR